MLQHRHPSRMIKANEEVHFINLARVFFEEFVYLSGLFLGDMNK